MVQTVTNCINAQTNIVSMFHTGNYKTSNSLLQSKQDKVSMLSVSTLQVNRGQGVDAKAKATILCPRGRGQSLRNPSLLQSALHATVV